MTPSFPHSRGSRAPVRSPQLCQTFPRAAGDVISSLSRNFPAREIDSRIILEFFLFFLTLGCGGARSLVFFCRLASFSPLSFLRNLHRERSFWPLASIFLATPLQRGSVICLKSKASIFHFDVVEFEVCSIC